MTSGIDYSLLALFLKNIPLIRAGHVRVKNRDGIKSSRCRRICVYVDIVAWIGRKKNICS